jgi:hypothetical protein
MPLQAYPVLSNFGVLTPDLVVQFIQAARQSYALGADDDAVKIAPLFRIDYVGTVE